MSEPGNESASDEPRYMEYIGERDVAKVEEHPFQEDKVSCMILSSGGMKGRALTPDQAREFADALNEAADRAEANGGDEDA